MRIPDWSDDQIVYEDDDLIAINKPPGVPTQAAQPEAPDDVVFRLAAFMAKRDGQPPYLGVHQRLDRDASGILLLTKHKRANRSIAEQFEGRSVIKEYLVGIDGAQPPATLRHRLKRAPDGRTEVTQQGGQLALGETTVTQRNGPRSLASVRLKTGRTHQARVQLAAVGAPIVGDRTYGGNPGPRLLLHAQRLALKHPTNGSPLQLEAPLPEEFDEWLKGPTSSPPTSAWLRRRIDNAVQARWGLAKSTDTTAFRLINGSGDGLEGVQVDVYGPYAVALVHEGYATADALLDELERLQFEGVYLKQKPRQANTLSAQQREALAPPTAARGQSAPEELVVLEKGIPYAVELGGGLGTGLFLDQRNNRQRVKDWANNASVLNLFAHTCGFTVAAAQGGAAQTMSVDVSRKVLERGRANVERVGGAAEHRFITADAIEMLAKLARRGERFDLVVVDPPTYASTKGKSRKASRWRSGRDWVALTELALGVLAPEGRLLACSNDSRLKRVKLRRYLHEAAERCHIKPRRLRDWPQPSDFPTACGEEPTLKSIAMELSD